MPDQDRSVICAGRGEVAGWRREEEGGDGGSEGGSGMDGGTKRSCHVAFRGARCGLAHQCVMYVLQR